jgi:hypothetical protein
MTRKRSRRQRSWPYVQVLRQNLPRRTEENNKIPHSGESVSRLRFEPGTSQIQVRHVTAGENLFGFPLRRPGFASGQSMWGLWCTKWHWGRFSPSTSVSLANHHSTNFSIIIITRVGTVGLLVATVVSGPNWNPPPYSNKKGKTCSEFPSETIRWEYLTSQ